MTIISINFRENRVLDYTSVDAKEVFGLIPIGLYSVELDSNSKPKTVLMTNGKVSNDIALFSPSTAIGPKYFSVEGIDSSGNLMIEKGDVKTRVKFKNSVSLETWYLNYLKKGTTLEEWLQTQGCSVVSCTFLNSTVVFASGGFAIRGEMELTKVGNEVAEITFSQIYDKKIELPGLNPKLRAQVESYAPISIKFGSDGRFSFNQSFNYYENAIDKLILKDGSAVLIELGKNYHLEFDENGNLTSATMIY